VVNLPARGQSPFQGSEIPFDGSQNIGLDHINLSGCNVSGDGSPAYLLNVSAICLRFLRTSEFFP
jgi:hypothetical protein